MEGRSNLNVRVVKICQNYYIDCSDRLGKGKYGTVYRGFDKTQKPIAVKVLDTSKFTQKQEREIQIMSRLRQNKHPNLLIMYDSFRNKKKNQLYLFLEYCSSTLEKRILQSEISRQTAYKYLQQLTSGLFFMHNLRLFHRDIKPDNILITENDTLKIADFGIARSISDKDCQVKYTERKCTPAYSAPQLFLKREYDEKCDMFSLGCVHFEMLTRKRLIPKSIVYYSDLEQFYTKLVQGKQSLDLSDHRLNEADRKLIAEMTQINPKMRLNLETLHKRLQAFDFNNAYTFKEGSKQEEESMIILASFKSRLQFRQKRCKYFLNVLKIIHKYQHLTSKFIPKIYKLAVIFFSLVKYCYFTTELINNNLAMQEYGQNPEQIHELVKKLTPQDYQALISYQIQLSKRLLIKRTSLRKFITQQILSQIEAVFEDPLPNQQKTLASQLKFIDIFALYRNSISQNIDMQQNIDFNDKYSICLNNLYKTTKELNQLTNEDLAIYLTLINVSYFDYIAQWNRNEDFPPSIEEISNLSREALIDKIKHFQAMEQ